MHLAPRLGLRPALDALRIELPHHFRIDLVEAKVPDPRQEEAVEQPLVPVDRGRLESGRCEGSQVLGCDLLENGPRLRLRRALFLRVSPPPVGDPVETRRASRRRSSARAAASICTSASRRNRPCDPSGFCIHDVKDQPPLAAALHDAHCHGRTAFPRRVLPRPCVYHGTGRRLPTSTVTLPARSMRGGAIPASGARACARGCRRHTPPSSRRARASRCAR